MLSWLGVNSLDMAMLVSALEERFHIELEATELQQLHTLEDLIARASAPGAASINRVA